jgi:DNA-binding NtrC family response regulator
VAQDLDDLLENRVMSGPGTYLEKPVSPNNYVRAIQRTLGIEETKEAVDKISLKQELESNLQGASPEAMRKALAALKNAGRT